MLPLDRRSKLALACVAAFLIVLLGVWLTHLRNIGPDSRLLYPGAQTALRCVEAQRTSCGRTPAELRASEYHGTSAVGPYALLQYPPPMAMLRAHLSRRQVFEGMSLLSVVAFLVMLGALVVVPVRMRAPQLAPLLVLCALTGPLLFYANNTLSEALSAALGVLVVAFALLRAPWILLALAAWLAGLSKETAPPFVLAVGALALLLGGTGRSRRGHVLALVGGCGAAVVSNALFNLFRYGGLTNTVELDYVRGHGRVPVLSAGQRAQDFAALLVSPNGGLALFWTSALLVVVVAAVWALRGARSAPRSAATVVTLGAFATLVALLVGLANWYQPFGWYAWGPRLALPWLPALVLLVVVAQRERLTGLLTRAGTRHPWWVAAGGAALALVALPQLGATLARRSVYTLFDPDPTCPRAATASSVDYFRCLDHRAWARHWTLLDALHGLATPAAILFAALFVAACAALALLATRLAPAPA